MRKLLWIALFLSSVGLTGCEQNEPEPMEEAGEAFEETGEGLQDVTEETVDSIEDSVE